jgi:hypothetical protein
MGGYHVLNYYAFGVLVWRRSPPSAAPTMKRRMDGWMDGYQYIYCLPPAGGCIRSQGRIRSQGNYYCLPPAGVLHSQNKVIKCAAYGVAQGGGAGLALLLSKIKKLKITLSFASPEKENYFFYIYDVITWEK